MINEDELIRCLVEFAGESDRATVVFGASFVDSILETILKKSLLPPLRSEDLLFDGLGPLSMFSAKIELAYRTRLIDAEFAKALHALRKLRNEFAHDISVADLADSRHKDRIDSMVEPLRTDASFTLRPPFLVNQPKGSRRDFRVALGVMVMRLRFLSKKAEPLCPRITLPLNMDCWDDEAKKST